MNLRILRELIIKAKNGKPPLGLMEYCSAQYQPYYHFMYLASLEVKGICVELGCEKGRGLVAMAMAGKWIIGIDHVKKPEIDDILGHYPNVTFWEQASLPVSDYFESREIGLLHIDTEHTFSMAKAEFEAYLPCLAKPSLILFDDLHAAEDDVLDYFRGLPYSKVQDDDLHPTSGWGVVLYE